MIGLAGWSPPASASSPSPPSAGLTAELRPFPGDTHGLRTRDAYEVEVDAFFTDVLVAQLPAAGGR